MTKATKKASKKVAASDGVSPIGLSASSAFLWARTLCEFDFSECEKAILQAGLEARDRYLEAKEEIDRDGMTYTDRFSQVKSHPAISIERDSRTQFLQALKTLHLNLQGME